MGEFLPIYSGIPSYSEEEFPSINKASPAPAWIRSIWGIRVKAKINGG